MKYTIIIPYHSNFALLQGCVESLINTVPITVEILIIANNPDPKMLEISDFNHRCRVVKYQEELFYPKAMNIGSQLASGDNLIFCDADTCYLPGWFEALTTFYKSNPQIGLCSSKLLYFSDETVLDYGIGFTQYNCPHPFKGRRNDSPLVSANKQVQAACTASSMISKSLFQRVGGFNELLVHSYSDIDLCLRLRKLGYSIWCVSDSLVYHKGASTIGGSMSENLKSDTKGIYTVLNANKFSIDMNYYFQQSWDYLKSTELAIPKEYYFIDFSTIADKIWYRTLIMELLHIKYLEVYIKPALERDCSHIPLYETLDWNIRNLKCPLLFFVDDFRILKNNKIWTSLRDTSSDLVIDRNANIIPYNWL